MVVRFARMLLGVLLGAGLACGLSACAVVSVVDAAVTVGAAAVSVGATVVETAVDVTAAGVKAAAGSDDGDEHAAQGTEERAGEHLEPGAAAPAQMPARTRR